MGIEEKLSNVSRRLGGRGLYALGRLTGSTRWQMAGTALWTSSVEEEARELGKDERKAAEAVSRYIAERPMLLGSPAGPTSAISDSAGPGLDPGLPPSPVTALGGGGINSPHTGISSASSPG